uniref:Uncharacterized protein n=1 Tax=Geobacillus sp. (strain Y4.1MC1) TaxID=581103 RepID=A0A7U3YFL6_GEOS0
MFWLDPFASTIQIHSSDDIDVGTMEIGTGNGILNVSSDQ